MGLHHGMGSSIHLKRYLYYINTVITMMTAKRDDYDKPHVLCTAVDSSDDDDKFIKGKKIIYRFLQVLGPNGESIQSQQTTVVSKVYNLINLYYVCGMLPFTTRPQNGLTEDRTLNLYLGLKANSLTTTNY